jgi:hypothetical protein
MPTWSEILRELNDSRAQGSGPQFDAIRRKYLAQLYQHTKREIILYATKWTQHDVNVSPDAISIVEEDIQGIMEVIHGLKGPGLDLILHSPGGSLEAAEAIVHYLRSKFRHIRGIVPQVATGGEPSVRTEGKRGGIKRFAVSGAVPVENYQELFRCFIGPAVRMNLKKLHLGV